MCWTYGAGVNTQGVNVVAVGLDNVVSQPVLGTQDHSELRAPVQLRRPNVRVVQLLQTGEVHVWRRTTVHLTRLKHHPWRRLLAQLSGLAEQRP